MDKAFENINLFKESIEFEKPAFHKNIPGFGELAIRLINLEKDIPILHSWVTQPYARFWGMQGKSLEEVMAEYIKITSLPHSDVFVGSINGVAAFFLERYHPEKDIVGKYYQVKKEDCGIHIIVAPPHKPVRNFTLHIFNSIMEFIFQDKSVERVIIEPDIRNEKMFTLSKKIGFEFKDIVELPHKVAQIGFSTRNNFFKKRQPSTVETSTKMNQFTQPPAEAVSHINKEVWAKANRLLVRKAICEFSHELLITPEKVSEENGWGFYLLKPEIGSSEYTFKAKILALNHWYVDINSIEKFKNKQNQPLDAILFIKEFAPQLGIKTEILPSYIEEITSTLYGSIYKLVKGNPTAKQLATADFQTIEQSMTEGHPGFVANNGRIGFDTSDYKAFAPETGNAFPLLWLAGHKNKTVYAGTQDLPYQTLIEQELNSTTIESFNQTIKDAGHNPEDYFFIPVHPWQWFNKVANIFTPEIASGDLICVGYGPDEYQAQQSIRTLFNLSNPHKFYTKTSLSILNMGFMRGLPVYYLGSAPEMAEWLEELLEDDDYIKETGFTMLGEVASVSYINPYFEEFGKHNAYNKMLASLWRESPMKSLKPEQRVMTMAALLHVDQNGDALLPELIKVSGVSAEAWLSAYLKAYLSPLLHCFYKYDLVFMPHGENIILVLENNIPAKIFMKDITEEAVILSPEVELPKNIDRMYAHVPDDIKLLSIFIDVFDGFFRFLSHVLVEHMDFDEGRFWQLVAGCIFDYQKKYPELNEKFEYYDLFIQDFKLSCLNRLQLNNNKTMIDLDDPVALLQFQGKLQNPIAQFKRSEGIKNAY